MKQFNLNLQKEVFHGSNVVLRFSFKTMRAWDGCALLAVQNHLLAMAHSISRGQSAHFWKKDCFECLSSNKVPGLIKKERLAKIAA